MTVTAPFDNPHLTRQPSVVILGRMTEQKPDISAHQDTFRRLREVRDEALRHMRVAQQLHAERRDLLRALIGEGFSQAEIARELGVTRQAIQKMLAG
jgi:DNA-directed RNA polymerase specialized sigma24 family protein